jgi:hypothetical protein
VSLDPGSTFPYPGGPSPSRRGHPYGDHRAVVWSGIRLQGTESLSFQGPLPRPAVFIHPLLLSSWVTDCVPRDLTGSPRSSTTLGGGRPGAVSLSLRCCLFHADLGVVPGANLLPERWDGGGESASRRGLRAQSGGRVGDEDRMERGYGGTRQSAVLVRALGRIRLQPAPRCRLAGRQMCP